MSNLKGTETLKNLMAAFAGESQARNRYTFWSSIAKKEGYVEVSKIFEETANQEKEHAKRLMKLMNTAAQGLRFYRLFNPDEKETVYGYFKNNNSFFEYPQTTGQ